MTQIEGSSIAVRAYWEPFVWYERLSDSTWRWGRGRGFFEREERRGQDEADRLAAAAGRSLPASTPEVKGREAHRCVRTATP